ncbi:hypothetical protein ASF55_15125 [Methylobacterium sp. Leaf119]|nr:hypothetical protein ASF55_15125 [Methylobacterium sp. Leaf119]
MCRIAGHVFCDPVLKNAGILVKLVGQATKFRSDRTFLFDYSIRQLPTEVSFGSKICCEDLHIS